MKLRELKPGQRVRVEGYTNEGVWINSKGSVTGSGSVWMTIRLDGNDLVQVGRRSCIPLKPKQKRREWWIKPARLVLSGDGGITGTWDPAVARETPPEDTTGWIRVREVVEK